MGSSPDPFKRLRIVLAVTGAFLVLVLLLGIAFWPFFLSGYAERKVTEALGRRFDEVEVGSFQLTRDSLEMTDVTLHKGPLEVSLDDVRADFSLGWGFVDVARVEASGRVNGEVPKPSPESETSPRSKGPSRVRLEETLVSVTSLEVDVLKDDVRVTGTANVTPESPHSWVVGVKGLKVTKVGFGTLLADTISSKVDRQETFPLQVDFEGASAEGSVMGDVKNLFEGVEGSVVLADRDLSKVSLDIGTDSPDGRSGLKVWSLRGEVAPRDEEFDVTFSATSSAQVSSLPFVKALPIQGGHLSTEFRAKGNLDEFSVDGDANVFGEIFHPKIARQKVDLNTRVKFHDVEVRPRDKKMVGGVFSLEFGPPAVVVRVEVGTVDPEEGIFSAHVTMDDTPCQDVLRALPEGLVPELRGFELEGSASMNMEFHVFLDAPDSTGFAGGPYLKKCRIVRLPQVVEMMKGPFSHAVRMKNGRVATRLMARGDYYFTPWERIPPSLPAAVLSTEDGSFWSHSGIRPHQLQASIRRNLREGEFARGGSTISMQAAKNLLLTHERTVSRKLQEMFLTWVIERELGKQRIMELYLNAVEFGPGIYGVGHAADHYFGKTPLELTSMESAFLATLLPRPISRHEAWCSGSLSPKYENYVRRVHIRMLKARRISREEYDRGKEKGIVFSRADWLGEAECIENGREVSAGKITQGALNGLTLGRADG